MMMPPLDFSSASTRLTITLSWSGRNLVFAMMTLVCRGLVLESGAFVFEKY
jgi:hypothetical protein